MLNSFFTSISQKIFLTTFFLFPLFSFASNYYWVGGTGDWSDYANHWATTSGGLVYHVQEPTPFDDVFFDNNSFSSTSDTVYIGPTIFVCHNMDWTGSGNSPTFSGYSSTGELDIYGSLTLIQSMTWSFSNIKFKSGTLGNTITSADHYIGAIFDGIGGGWTLMDTLNSYGPIIINGSFFSNNQVINCDGFFTQSNSVCNIYLGTSQINIIGNSSWNFYPSSSVALDADSATITFTNTGGSIFYGGNNVYHDVYFNGVGTGFVDYANSFDKLVANANLQISNNNTFDTLFFNNPGKTVTLQSGKTQTIIDTLIGNGTCAALTLLKSSTAATQATISKASGNVVVGYFLMQDVNATGGANFTANNSIAISNVTGWTIPVAPLQNLFWVGGTGDWNDPMHWSTTSGGMGGSCVPTPFDNVYFDTASFATTGQDVSIQLASAYCNDISWIGAKYDPAFNVSYALNVFGSLSFIDTMNISAGDFIFRATTLGKTITTARHNIGGFTFDGTGGGWSLMDTTNASYITVANGSVFSNNQVINCDGFFTQSNSVCNIYLGTSQINIIGNSSWNFYPSSSVALDADSATITFTNTGGSIFYGGNNVYHDVYFNGVGTGFVDYANSFDKLVANANLQISNNNTFDTLFFNNPGKTVTLQSGKTQTIIDTLIGNGTCAALTLLKSSTAATQATISKASGNVVVGYFLMQDVNATGGANFTANNSIAISNVTGWTIPVAPLQNLFWVGGTGDWNDPMHWSTTSGGMGGSCVPTPFDNVYFDTASFATTGQDVSIQLASAYCNDISWIGAKYDPAFNVSYALNVFGSLSFIDTMNISAGDFIFRATTLGKTITTARHNIGGFTFDGTGGGWSLMDTTNASYITVANGSVFSNNQVINCDGFFTQSNSVCNIYLGTSQINIIGNSSWNFYPSSSVALDADSATITFTNTGGSIFYGGNNVYHDVYFNGVGTGFVDYANSFDKLVANANLQISNNNTFDTLFFNNPGKTVTLQSGKTQTINSSIQANATGGFPISLISSSPGIQSAISMPLGDTACLNYIYMQDQNAIGGGIFYAGIYSSNISNNTGWQFSNCVQPISDVWPGDANYDLITNNLDILNIGIAYNQSGFVRPGASTNYVAQPCLDWPAQFITGVNVKHADTDGNGIVNMNDTLAVSLNYGITHPPRLSTADSTATTAPDIYFQWPAGPYIAGTWVSVDVDLGTAALQASSVYGLAFTVNYPSTMMVANTLSVSYNGSWLVPSGNNIHLEKNFFANSKIDLGFSRISHTNISGNGKVVTLTFQLATSASGPFMLTFTNILLDDNLGNVIPVNDISSTIYVGVDEHPDFSAISIYPNPSSGIFNIDLGEKQVAIKSSIDVMDLSGRTVLSIPAENKKIILLDLENEPNGVYFIRVLLSDGNVIMKKVAKE